MLNAQEYLRLIRETPMTQDEVSRRTGVTQGTISKIERGEVKPENVTASTYLALKALHDELHPEPAATPAPSGGWDGNDRRKEARA